MNTFLLIIIALCLLFIWGQLARIAEELKLLNDHAARRNLAR